MALTNAIGNTTEDNIMNLFYRAVTIAGYAATAGTETNIGMSLHTADAGEAGTASTNEMTTGAYTGYTRVNVARSTGGWSASSGGSISPAANVDFPAGTGGTGATATHFASAASNATPPTGAAVILWRGDITPTIACGNGVTPRLTTGTTISLD
jgi:hypothetical protein